MTPQQLLQCMPLAGARASVFAGPLTDSMIEFSISTPKAQAAYLAHLCHESGSLRYTEEIADGRAYEFRKDLGNVEPGDGEKYKGRALIQITGRNNYKLCGAALGLPLEGSPELLSLPANAARASAWFWNSKGLTALAESDKFGAITKLINGGYNGLDDRIGHWLRIRKVLGV